MQEFGCKYLEEKLGSYIQSSEVVSSRSERVFGHSGLFASLLFHYYSTRMLSNITCVVSFGVKNFQQIVYKELSAGGMDIQRSESSLWCDKLKAESLWKGSLIWSWRFGCDMPRQGKGVETQKAGAAL